MINVLINAYAVAPGQGSEQGMAWNWIVHLSEYCNLHIITEGQWRQDIENALSQHPNSSNLHFHYIPVSQEIREMCWNQGDWRFYFHYRCWQKRALSEALKICSEQTIDILHQLNMIGFREPGFLWKIQGIPFVWGPVGGMELMPKQMLANEPFCIRSAVIIKNILNDFQRKHQVRLRKALYHSALCFAATSGVKQFIENYYGKQAILLNETGCSANVNPLSYHGKGLFDILWVGKFDNRKQLGLALRIIAGLQSPMVRFHVIGGNEEEIERYRTMSRNLGLEGVVTWHGRISHSEVQEFMRHSEVLLFTSIMEGTPHVVLESIQNGLPVVCFDCCGQGDTIDSSVGIKVKLMTPEIAVSDFIAAISSLIDNPQRLFDMKIACSVKADSLSWDSKARLMVVQYNKILGIS